MSIRRLSGYFLLEFLRPFFICTLGLIMIFLLMTIQNELPNNISTFEVIWFLLGALLIKFNYIMSCSFFISGIYVMFQFNQNNELIACQSAGIYQLKALSKIFYFCLFIVVFLFFIDNVFSSKIEKYHSSLRLKSRANDIQFRVFYKQSLTDNHYRLWSFMTNKDKEVKDFSVIEKKDEAIIQQFFSSIAYYQNNQWILENPVVLIGEELKKYEKITKNFNLDYKTLVRNNLLYNKSEKNKIFYNQKNQRAYEIEYYTQLLSPLLCITMLLLGMTFSIQDNRRIFYISYPFIAVLVFIFFNRLMITFIREFEFLPIIPMLLLASIIVIVWRGKKIV